MKIGLIIWDLTVSGGTQRQVIELARDLGRRHEVQVFCYAYDVAKCFPELTKGLDIHSLATVIPAWPGRPASKLGAFWYDSYGQFRVFDRQIHDLADSIPDGFDVINAHDTFTDRVGFYYKQRCPQVRMVWMSNDSPAVFLILDDQAEAATDGGLKKRLGDAVQRWLFARAAARGRRYVSVMDAVVVLDARNKRQVDELMDKQALIVRSGLDIDKFTPATKPSNPVFAVLGTGILFRHRHFEDLIAAIGLLVEEGRKVHLNIIGKPTFDPVYAKELTDLVTKLGLEKTVSFLGTVSEQELLRQYREAGVFVFPNHKQTWGLAVFEAMASGTPVIVSRTSGAHEVLTDGENALLVDPVAPKQIAAQIGRLIDDGGLRDKLAVSGRKFVESNITWKKYAENMERVFKGEKV